MWGLMIAKSIIYHFFLVGQGSIKTILESDAFLDTIKELKHILGQKYLQTKPLNKESFLLHVESKSIDTYENAKLSKAASFEKEGIEQPTIYLVTSAYHMRRSTNSTNTLASLQVIPAATGFKISSREKDAWDYLPSMWALERSYIALHEYAGLLSLKLRGIN